jgi:hypothetical protein
MLSVRNSATSGLIIFSPWSNFVVVTSKLSTMQGDGKKELKEWLHATGKDIGKMVGDHLKKTAKEKAVSYAQEQLGLGLMDSLKAGVSLMRASNDAKSVAMRGSGPAGLNQWLRDTDETCARCH